MKVISCKFHPFCHELYLKENFQGVGQAHEKLSHVWSNSPFPVPHCPACSPRWSACWARQDGCPCFSPSFKWIFTHPVALARECRSFSKLPYAPYSVLFNHPVNGAIAFKYGRQFASNEDVGRTLEYISGFPLALTSHSSFKDFPPTASYNTPSVSTPREGKGGFAHLTLALPPLFPPQLLPASPVHAPDLGH